MAEKSTRKNNPGATTSSKLKNQKMRRTRKKNAKKLAKRGIIQ